MKYPGAATPNVQAAEVIVGIEAERLRCCNDNYLRTIYCRFKRHQPLTVLLRCKML